MEATTTISGKAYEVEERGHLKDPSDWDESWAKYQAENQGLEYSDYMREAVMAARAYYTEYNIPPSNRALRKQMGVDRLDERALGIYYTSRDFFKIAGLPRPTGCL